MTENDPGIRYAAKLRISYQMLSKVLELPIGTSIVGLRPSEEEHWNGNLVLVVEGIESSGLPKVQPDDVLPFVDLIITRTASFKPEASFD
jgi:hypothetical protein